MDLENYLLSIHQLPVSEIEILIKKLRFKSFRKGDNVVSTGQIQKEIYFVNKGVLMYMFEANGKSNILGFSYPPSFSAIPESFFFQKPAKYHLICLSDCELSYVNYDDLQNLFDRSRQIERLFRKLAESFGVGLINRQIELRSTSIEERFMAFFSRSPHLLQLIPHKYIASYLDIDPTNFSKLFNSIKI